MIRPFRWRIAFTYALTVIEDLLELSYPWATGLAINGLLAHDYRMIGPVMLAWVLHTATGCARQMYDTRLYTALYNSVVIDTVLRQRQLGIEPTKVAARSVMSREFVTFLTDLAAPKAVFVLRDRIGALNPGAKVVQTVDGEISPGEFRSKVSCFIQTHAK